MHCVVCGNLFFFFFVTFFLRLNDYFDIATVPLVFFALNAIQLSSCVCVQCVCVRLEVSECVGVRENKEKCIIKLW